MPAKSKAQFRFMQAVAHGTAKNKPKGLSKTEAAEYVEGQSAQALPEHKKKTRKQVEANVRKGLKKAFPK